MKLAIAQMGNAGSPAENLEKSLEMIRQAAEKGADLILFPEVQLTEFFPQYPGQDATAYAVREDGETVRAFREACRENRIYGAPNLYLEQAGNYYDATFLIGPDGEIIGIQKMVHIAQAEKFYEQDYYSPSDDGFLVFDTGLGRIAVTVCFDRHYPESIRTEALKGADLVLIPTVNVKAEPLEMFEWEIRVQSFHNSVFCAMANRVGREGEMDFAGESLVTDPNGDLIVKADDREQIVYADLDLARAGEVRRSRPYTQLRRPELYR